MTVMKITAAEHLADISPSCGSVSSLLDIAFGQLARLASACNEPNFVPIRRYGLLCIKPSSYQYLDGLKSLCMCCSRLSAV